MQNAYESHLEKSEANYTPLTPLSLIARTAFVYPRHTSVIHGGRRYTWEDTYERSRRLPSARRAAAVRTGDTVAVMASHAAGRGEAHHGVPSRRGVLHT